jgi:ADP-ribose pyrophosphatase YjhB (NUDIX family)
MHAIPVRQSARLMLVDTLGRLLLFRYDDGAHSPFWATIGGRILPGETYEATAARELAKETGYTDAIGPLIRTRDEVFATADVATSRWLEHYFAVRTRGGPIRTSGWTDEERATIREARWWTVDELRATTETILPTWLADERVQLLNRSAASCESSGEPATWLPVRPAVRERE